MDNVTDLEAVRSAESAERLLKDAALKRAFEQCEEDYLKALLHVADNDDLGRFRFAEAIKVCKMVRRHLSVAVENGKLSAKVLEEVSKPKSRFRF